MSKYNKLLNSTFVDSMKDNNDIHDIDSWFDDDAESSMIFIFLSCIIALIAFLLMLFLCFKHERLRKLLFLYIISPPTADAAEDNIHSNTGHILIYLLSIICILILAHAIIKSLTKGIRYFCCYQTTTYFLCEHGHDKGPSAAIALELSTLLEITHVHIAHINIPITRLWILETDHNAYYVVSGNWFYDFLKLLKPITLIHRNGVIPIRTPMTFEIGFFQSFKL